MAIFGSLGKALGLGSTQQVLGGVARAALGDYVGGLASSLASSGTQTGQSVAVSQAPQTTPAETQTSGTITFGGYMPVSPQAAMLGGALPAVTAAGRSALQQAGRFLTSPTGQIGVGLGVGALTGAMLDSTPSAVKITRKQQAQLRQLVEMVGIEQAAAIVGLSVGEVALILTKKFRTRGRGVTAAQLRTAKRVNNRIVHMYDSLKAAYGTTTTRRAPARRTTRVTQIKN